MSWPHASIRWDISTRRLREGRSPNAVPTRPPPPTMRMCAAGSIRCNIAAVRLARGRIRQKPTRTRTCRQPHVAAAGINPLDHYLQFGSEGRATSTMASAPARGTSHQIARTPRCLAASLADGRPGSAVGRRRAKALAERALKHERSPKPTSNAIAVRVRLVRRGSVSRRCARASRWPSTHSRRPRRPA